MVRGVQEIDGDLPAVISLPTLCIIAGWGFLVSCLETADCMPVMPRTEVIAGAWPPILLP